MNEIRTPYLIQRMKRRSLDYTTDSKGVDRCFRMDYMGSSEFECGALPKALKLMRSCCEKAKVLPFTAGGLPFHFVGAPSRLEAAKQVFEDQLGPRKLRFKESTYIDTNFDPKNKYSKCECWWAIDTDAGMMPWAVFVKPEDAQKWLELAYPS